MPTLNYLNESFECATAIKGDNYIHLLDENGIMVAAFDHISDFSSFTLEDGNYVSPTADHDCRVAVVRDDGTIAPGSHTCADIGNAVPKTRTVNGKTLDKDVRLGAGDIGSTLGDQVYSKNESLSAETKTKYGLNAAATPDDVLRWIREELSIQKRVGDTVRTYRTDMGENWLPCDGRYFDPDEYPELAEVTPHPTTFIELGKHTYNSAYSEGGYAEGNGYQVMCRTTKLPDTGRTGIEVKYSTDYFKTHESVVLDDHATGANYAYVPEQVRVFFVNRYWVVLDISSRGEIHVRYCADTPGGTWSAYTSIESAGYVVPFGMWYDNGKYYLATAASNDTDADDYGRSYPYIIMSSDIGFTAPTAVMLDTNAGSYSGFIRTDEHVVFAGSTDAGMHFVYAPVNALINATHRVDAGVNGSLQYVNGYYILNGDNGLYYTTDITSGVWNLTELEYAPGGGRVMYERGEYIALRQETNGSGSGDDSGFHIAFGSDLTDASSFQYSKKLDFYTAAGGANVDVIGSTTFTMRDGFIPIATNRFVLKLPMYVLPTSDPAPLHEYIKVREVPQ